MLDIRSSCHLLGAKQGCFYAGRCWSGPTSTHENRPAVTNSEEKNLKTNQQFIFLFIYLFIIIFYFILFF